MKRKLPSLPPIVRRSDHRLISAPPKRRDRVLGTAAHVRWRELVLERAGYRCEAMLDDGTRCTRCTPLRTLIADHVIERSDGGAPFDPANGQCLCPSHHGLKTNKAKRARWMG